MSVITHRANANANRNNTANTAVTAYAGVQVLGQMIGILPKPATPPQTGTPPSQQAQPMPPPPAAQAHKQKKQSTGRGRTTPKHQKGTARKARDQGGEKADPNRKKMPFHKKKPKKWKGPWPPKPDAV